MRYFLITLLLTTAATASGPEECGEKLMKPWYSRAWAWVQFLGKDYKPPEDWERKWAGLWHIDKSQPLTRPNEKAWGLITSEMVPVMGEDGLTAEYYPSGPHRFTPHKFVWRAIGEGLMIKGAQFVWVHVSHYAIKSNRDLRAMGGRPFDYHLKGYNFVVEHTVDRLFREITKRVGERRERPGHRWMTFVGIAGLSFLWWGKVVYFDHSWYDQWTDIRVEKGDVDAVEAKPDSWMDAINNDPRLAGTKLKLETNEITPAEARLEALKTYKILSKLYDRVMSDDFQKELAKIKDPRTSPKDKDTLRSNHRKLFLSHPAFGEIRAMVTEGLNLDDYMTQGPGVKVIDDDVVDKWIATHLIGFKKLHLAALYYSGADPNKFSKDKETQDILASIKGEPYFRELSELEQNGKIDHAKFLGAVLEDIQFEISLLELQEINLWPKMQDKYGNLLKKPETIENVRAQTKDRLLNRLP